MPSELTNIKHEALSLSERDRAKLAKDLLDSLDGDEKLDVSKAWDIEICRRINEIESGEAQLLNADEVMSDVKKGLNI
ncbi:MAG: addiction module protein [Thalassolituus sp.]|jgi:putative addiction module component (TIGR02574 family)